MSNIESETHIDVGSLLIPTAVERIAEAEPEAVWISVPLPPIDGRYEYKDVTYKQFANAINGAAWWLERQMGKGDRSQSLAFFGSGGGDIGYPIIMLAAVKAGYFVSGNIASA
ncbi:hypothetical protein P7C71_g5538, partial [Lecanoromycetidae sp. Uapishka_2]